MLKPKDIVVNRHCLYLPFLHFILYVSIKSLYYFQSIDLTEEPKNHTEKWRAQRFYIAEIVRQRGIVGAWRNRGYLRVLLMFCLLHYKAVVCKIYYPPISNFSIPFVPLTCFLVTLSSVSFVTLSLSYLVFWYPIFIFLASCYSCFFYINL